MTQVLYKLLVNKFYKLNAGFFLFLFIVLFGIMPGADTIILHRQLMLAAVSSWAGLTIMTIVFGAYALKCVLFVLRELATPENVFIYNMQGLTNGRQLRLLFFVFTSLLSPVLIYGAITVAAGAQAGQALAAGAAGILLGLCATGTYILFATINGTWKQPLGGLPKVGWLPRKQFLTYLLFYSVDNKKGVFISVKIFSLLALQFMVALNADKVSKENICFLILLSIAAHALLPLYYIRFIESEMAFLRNMPLRLGARLSQLLVTYAIILLPELLFLAWNEAHVLQWHLIAALYLLAIARLMFYSVLQYLPRMTTERYTGIIFISFFVSIILLASVSLWFFVISEFALAMLLYSLLYYKYEHPIENEG
jgi:hypothetical protein